ncbi:MAG: NAD-dependent epimerase/dehydratase family protein [Flavobacteriales bacterium]|nr:NAD-dependent epimerase/dehydratase family protein [Flavobacteriales bacterium]MCW8914141.1 NAD-dependent epimerase/dehydratase family protein [Flavobacteriales bacterium]MCW8937909.1 NAD-dependent epimerase/dehydratase family protein [Flavobacteriales bacterium]MCW8940755.1 NAD-dependent epimerase/dehydratase family protein [Flavobacteriales bacterium]MCW8967341.1 NAD-dependent epimerase/dehydratase family protein [Flavobacteriales bacterium]
MNNKTTILVTGGAGFVGGSLVEGLIKDVNNFVVVVDNLKTGDKNKLPNAPKNNLKFIQCDVNNLDEIRSVFHTFSFDYVFHYAALVGVQRTLENPIEVLKDINGIENILKLSKNTGVKKVIYSSSSEVYGEPVEYPQNEETTPLNSRLPYAIVKNVGEAFLKSYKQEYDLDYVIYRFFNTYGPKQSKDFVISKFINAALNNNDITIYGDGSQTRTFCYVQNNVEATIKAAFSDEYVNQTINIGNDVETSIIGLAKLIIRLTGSSSKIVHLPPLEEGDMTRRKPDITKMKQLLGNNKIYTLEEGLTQVLKNTSFIL